MKKYIALVLASFLILAFATSAFAATIRAAGNVGETYIELYIDESMSAIKGDLLLSDSSSNKAIAGEITSVSVSGSTVSFNGSYIGEDDESHTFQGVAEDLGAGDGTDKVTITLSDGSAKGGVLGQGGVVFIQ